MRRPPPLAQGHLRQHRNCSYHHALKEATSILIKKQGSSLLTSASLCDRLTPSSISDDQLSRGGHIILQRAEDQGSANQTHFRAPLSVARKTVSCPLVSPRLSDTHLHVTLQQGRRRLVLWVVHIPADT